MALAGYVSGAHHRVVLAAGLEAPGSFTALPAAESSAGCPGSAGPVACGFRGSTAIRSSCRSSAREAAAASLR